MKVFEYFNLVASVMELPMWLSLHRGHETERHEGFHYCVPCYQIYWDGTQEENPMTTAQQKKDEKLWPARPWPARAQKMKILSEKVLKAGYRIETVLVDNLPYMGKPMKNYAQMRGRWTIIRRAMTNIGGHYIGEASWGHRIFVKRGLDDVQPQAEGQTCCVGFDVVKMEWYGWSHRAMVGFGIGDKIFDVDWKPKKSTTEEEMDKIKFIERGGRTIKTLAQAKKAALAFADYVS